MLAGCRDCGCLRSEPMAFPAEADCALPVSWLILTEGDPLTLWIAPDGSLRYTCTCAVTPSVDSGTLKPNQELRCISCHIATIEARRNK